MIDPATSWFEAVEIPDTTSKVVSLAVDRTWFCRYPRPEKIIYDKGHEFTAKEFQELFQSYGIDGARATTENPQANSVVERVHGVLGDMLRTFQLEHNEINPMDPWSDYLAAAAWAIRATYHTTLQASPAQLIFGRDMILNTTFRANWEAIRQRKQDRINKNNQRENALRAAHVYNVNDKVLVARKRIQRKLNLPRKGPYTITQVYSNGTVRIQRGVINERINIRHLTPYHSNRAIGEANAAGD